MRNAVAGMYKGFILALESILQREKWLLFYVSTHIFLFILLLQCSIITGLVFFNVTKALLFIFCIFAQLC